MGVITSHGPIEALSLDGSLSNLSGHTSKLAKSRARLAGLEYGCQDPVITVFEDRFLAAKFIASKNTAQEEKLVPDRTVLLQKELAKHCQ